MIKGGNSRRTAPRRPLNNRDAVHGNIGLRRTRQRDAILSSLRASHGPLTVTQLYRRARQDCKNLGIATVYRTLKLLQETGDIRTVWFTDGEPRYEPASARRRYFVCTTCFDVEHLADTAAPVDESARLPSGYSVQDHELTLIGTCAKCAARSNTTDAERARKFR